MKQMSIRKSIIGILFIILCDLTSAQQTKISGEFPEVIYDEAKVPVYTLPNSLVMLSGGKVINAKEWQKKRRPEVLELFEKYMYGYTMKGRPEEMSFKMDSIIPVAMDGKAVIKLVTIYFAGENGPKMKVKILLPSGHKKPVPVFIVPFSFMGISSTAVDMEKFSGHVEELLKHGYGLVNFDPTDIDPDRADGYQNSIRKFYARPGQEKPKEEEWGTLGGWAWAMSRVMDYIETDPDIDAQKVCLTGYSRYGKAALWAAAQDERFAIVFSGQSGCGGAALSRREFGETVLRINTSFPYWFCDNFKKFNNCVNKLPVDQHLLLALIAPRPLYIETSEEDLWGDPKGSFLSGKGAESVYELFGEEGLGAVEMPAAETSVGETIGFHMRKGGHMLGYTDYDWEQFLKFSDRHFGAKREK
jgi:hypothetical protein